MLNLKSRTPAKPTPKAKPKKEEGPVQSLHDMGLEIFEVREINRAELKKAEYNPRTINDNERRKLAQGLKTHGMVSPVVWNERTGNIVGGHQRISALDTLAKTKNYTLQVSVINVDDAKEKELNLILNNPEAQGAWDLEKLAAMFKDQSVKIENTGFDHADLYRILGDSPFADRGADSDLLTEQLQKTRQAFDNIMSDKIKTKESVRYYLVVVFKDEEDCDAFIERGKLIPNRYQSGNDIRRLCGFAVPGESEE